MRPTRLLRSESFRLAAIFAGLFLALTGVLLLAVLWIVDRTELASLADANDADIAAVENGYRGEGVDEAIEVTRQLVGGPLPAGHAFTGALIVLESDTQGKLAGNLPALTPTPGLHRVSFASQPTRTGGGSGGGGRLPAEIYGRGADIAPGLHIFVGRDTAEMLRTRRAILEAFEWLAAGALSLACVGGVLFGTQFLRHVDSITRTCEAIIAGRFEERIPAREGGNEWDRLARVINEMLNRISTLFDNLRQVSSDVAHDLRTPLSRLRARLEQAKARSVTTHDYELAVTQAIDDTDQLLNLFSALLRISQIESGSRLASLAPLELSELLENIFHMYRPVAEDRQQTLSADIQKRVVIRGDAELVTQMFSNLIENAIRHTPARTHIRLELTAAQGRATAFVRDDGPGIPASERPKVWQRFYQLSHSRSSGGHGLGLALVAAIAGLHKASLELADADPGLRVSVRF